MVKNTNIPLKINLYSLMLIITFVFVIGCGMENKKRSEAKAKGDFLLEAIAEGKAVELFPKDLFPIEQTRAVMHDLQHKCDFKNRKGVFVNDNYQKIIGSTDIVSLIYEFYLKCDTFRIIVSYQLNDELKMQEFRLEDIEKSNSMIIHKDRQLKY